jgi:alginate O-acetyltransferase complex protein AlgI
MLFCTYTFVLFFAIVLCAIRLSERVPRIQKVLLLAASNVFYGYWDWRFLILIWISTVLDYTVGRRLGSVEVPRARRGLLTLSIVGNLAMLGVFKYYDFFALSAGRMLDGLGWHVQPALLNVALPVGISFYTFQTMSYTIDVYRGRTKPCRDLLVFAQYVCFFPQLVAGPIERAGRLIPQLAETHRVRAEGVMSGLLLIVWGSFKKAFVADTLGRILVDPFFADARNGAELWVASAAFGVQIYCDFSGYCDVARGAARCMGVELTENFRAPYAAANITEFWRRWHVTLSSWFRDYVYIPLGGNRAGRRRTYCNLIITMLLCGLWHGANMTFVLWGALHGAALLLHRRLRSSSEKRLPKLVAWAVTFLFVTYAWMLFRLSSDADIAPFTMEMLSPMTGIGRIPLGVWLLLLAGFMTVVASHYIQIRQCHHGERIEEMPLAHPIPLGLAAGGALVLIVALGTFQEGSPFIYFQF